MNDPSRTQATFVPLLANGEKLLMCCAFAASLALFTAVFLWQQPFASRLARVTASQAAADKVTVPAFNIDAELGSLLLSESVLSVDLAAGADVGPAETFARANGPPLNLLAQVGGRQVERALAAALVGAGSGGPALTEDEQLVVTANAGRREVNMALGRLHERAASDGVGVAAALAALPLVRRAEMTTHLLDSYGDAILLADGNGMKQMALLGFYACRADALRDIKHAEAILG